MSATIEDDSNRMAKSKNNFGNADTGLEYHEDSVTYEIEAEKQYVARLRQQRQRIEALYKKYDKLLAELSKKDKIIKEQQKKIGDLDYQCKSLSLMAPELEFMRGQNSEVSNENNLLKGNLQKLEKQFHQMTNQFHNKFHMKNQQKEEFSTRNEQLVQRIKLVTRKMEDREAERNRQQKSLKDNLQELSKQLTTEKSQYYNEVSNYRNQLLKRDQQCHVLQLQNSQMRQKMMDMAEMLQNQRVSSEQKLTLVKNDRNSKLKALHKQVSELTSQNDSLYHKVKKLQQEFETLTKSYEELSNTSIEDRRASDQALYELKVILAQERSFHRQQIANYESELARLERMLNEAVRKEEELVNVVKRLQAKEGARKNLRNLEKEQLEKINRLVA